jgi:hypothetical protein
VQVLHVEREQVVARGLPQHFGFRAIELGGPCVFGGIDRAIDRPAGRLGHLHRRQVRDLLVAVIPIEAFDVDLQRIGKETVLRADRIGRQPFGRE